MPVIKRLLHMPSKLERAYFSVLMDNGTMPGRPTFDEFRRDMKPTLRILDRQGL